MARDRTRDRASDEDSRRARRDLERLSQDGGIMGSPVMRSKVKSVRDHFTAGDADRDDPIEVAATRTGRLLGLVAFVGLALWLFYTYAMN